MKIDLGKESLSAGCCSAPSPCDSGKKIYYPSLYLSGTSKMDLPDEGEALISFKKVSSGMDERDGEEPHYRCELEVRSIEPKGGKRDEEPMGTNVGKALKEAMRKKLGKGGYEE